VCCYVHRFTGTATHTGLPSELVLVRHAINTAVPIAADWRRHRCRTRERDQPRERSAGDEP
jgi:hypothetical protein